MATAADKTAEEAKEQAKTGVARLNEDRSKGEVDPQDFSKPRTKAGGRDRSVTVSEIEVPAGLDLELYSPTGIAARFDGLPITGEVDTQQFFLDEDTARYLVFTRADQNLPKKRLYTVKAFNPNGTLVQLPSEAQIQNNAGGDEGDMIGLRRYERKGFILLMDWTNGLTVYCAAWDCFAQSTGSQGQRTEFPNFCGIRHARHTLPNLYPAAASAPAGFFGVGATTSRTWSAD